MATVKVHRFTTYDVRTDRTVQSARPAMLDAIERCRGTPIMEPTFEVDSARIDGNGFLTQPTPQQLIDELNQRVQRDEIYKQLRSAAEARLVPTAISPGGYEILDGSRRVLGATPADRAVVGVFSAHFQELWDMYGGCAPAALED